MIFSLDEHRPFDCQNCTREDQEKNNCHNRYDLIDPAYEHLQNDAPIENWFLNDVKEKWRGKYKGSFPLTVLLLGNIRLYECPNTWITQDTIRLKNALFLGENPEKIYPGTWIDQPQWYIDAISIYREVKNYLTNKKIPSKKTPIKKLVHNG